MGRYEKIGLSHEMGLIDTAPFILFCNFAQIMWLVD